MNRKTHLSEEEFDQFCRELVNATQAHEDEIHAAANAPFLYQRLRAQIAAEQNPLAVILPPRSSALSVVAAWGVLTRLGQGGRWAFGAAALALVVWVGWQMQQPATPQVAEMSVTSASPQEVAQATTAMAPATAASPADTTEKPLPTTRKTITAKTAANKSVQAVPHSSQEIEADEDADAEIATDFMPLTYTAQRDEQNAQIVRMEMPRAVLATMGVPIANVTGDRIKADVMLRDDGVALAIRFIQEQ